MLKIFVSLFILISFSANAQVAMRQESIDIRNTEINNQHPAARATANTLRPTSDCIAGTGAGIQGMDFGFAITGSSQSKPCNIRAYSQALLNMGRKHLAFYVLMQDPIVKKAYEEMAVDLGIMDNPDAEVINCEYPTPQCKRSRK